MFLSSSPPRPHQQIWVDGAPLDAPPVFWLQKRFSSVHLRNMLYSILFGGLEHEFMFSIYWIIIPTDKYISEGLKPPTSIN